MSIFNFPFLRRSLPSLGNPVYSDDLLAANQLTIDGLSALTNLPNPGFAIISGMAYTPGSPGSFAPGIFWLNGIFYLMQTPFPETLFLIPNLQDINSEPFSDTNSRNTYTQYYAQTSTVATPQSTPQFSGNMNANRIGLNDLKTALISAQATIAGLGNSATRDVGIIPGTVAAGDDPRLVGPVSFFLATFAQINNVIIKGTVSGAYAPVNPGDPVNKNYTDTNFVKKLASGNTNVGDVPNGGITIPIFFPSALPDTNYAIFITVISLGTPFNDATVHTPAVFGKTTAGCQVRLQEGVGVTQNISLDWIVFSK